MKKGLSILLCIVMLLSAFAVVPCAAYDPQDQPIQLPRIAVVTADGNGTTLQKADGYVDAEITITDTDGSTLSGSVQFKVRGNTTAMENILKKAYNFKFSKKQEVLGMGKGKKWVLIANAFDPSLMRNFVAFSVAQHLGLKYTSLQKFVEVWVDGSFRGLYTLMEPVQEGKDRVDIDIESNGGLNDFMVEYERLLDEEEVTYFTAKTLRFAVKEPEAPTNEQLAYIEGIMNDIVGTVVSGSREQIEEKIDVESFVKYFLLNEYMKTYDLNTSSVFYYYQNGKLHAGPPWDYDMSSGNTIDTYQRGKDVLATDGVYANRQLLQYLYRHEWFRQEVREAFCENYLYLHGVSADSGLMDGLRSEYGDAIARNFSLTEWGPGRRWYNLQRQPYGTYEENYTYVKDWLTARCEWLRDDYGVYLTGDTDGDFEITVLDATCIQRILADYDMDEVEKRTQRGRTREEPLSILDATSIQRWIADYHVDAPIGEAALYE